MPLTRNVELIEKYYGKLRNITGYIIGYMIGQRAQGVSLEK